jgi:hypothetical protein
MDSFKQICYTPYMPRGGKRLNAGRKKEFDAVYPLKYKQEDRDKWERMAKDVDLELSEWIRHTLNSAKK